MRVSILTFMTQIYCWWCWGNKTETKRIVLPRNLLPKDTKKLHLRASTPEYNFISPHEGGEKCFHFHRNQNAMMSGDILL